MNIGHTVQATMSSSGGLGLFIEIPGGEVGLAEGTTFALTVDDHARQARAPHPVCKFAADSKPSCNDKNNKHA
eukprot:9383024-Pyramimonas_sp.AAC.1